MWYEIERQHTATTGNTCLTIGERNDGDASPIEAGATQGHIAAAGRGADTEIWQSPKTIYRLTATQVPSANDRVELSPAELQFLDEKFLLITVLGEMKPGLAGFEHWCRQRRLPLDKTVAEYMETQQRCDASQNGGLISGMEKLRSTKGYDKIHLDELHYLDFYAIERFGKTRLGTLLHYAKQGQNKFLMRQLVAELKPKLTDMLSAVSFDAVGYVPPTIRREVQLMKYLETHLQINLPKVRILKISGIIPVPQKSLNKIEERISNAENTFTLNERVKYRHVLLIDDAVGSGSTLNQIAGKLKQKGIAQQVTGLAVVGSFKGFDVVTDV